MNVKRSSLMRKLKNLSEKVLFWRISPDGYSVFGQGEDQLQIYELETGKLRATFFIPGTWGGFEFSPTTDMLVSS